MRQMSRGSQSAGARQEKRSLVENIRRFAAKEAVALLIALILLIAAFSTADPNFATVRNTVNIARSVGVLGISATGVTIGLIGGVFDLSIASVADLASVVTVMAYLQMGLSPNIAMLVGLTAGMGCGLLNGIIVTRFRINPIIATLGTAGIFRGMAFLVSGGLSHAVGSAGFRWLGRSRLLGIPSPVIIMGIVMLLGYVILRYSRFGRHTYAVGGNPVASRLAGINVDRHRLYLFVLISFCASLGGLVLLSKLGTALPNAAAGTELDTIAAAILGGTALAGGGGTIQGTLVGVLILGTLRNGLVINNVNPYWQEITSGIALIIAVAIDRLRSGGYR